MDLIEQPVAQMTWMVYLYCIYAYPHINRVCIINAFDDISTCSAYVIHTALASSIVLL
jgi:hypothetical protein